MTARHDLDRRLADFYAAEAPPRAPDWVLGQVLATVDITPQRRQVIRTPWSMPPMQGIPRLAVAALVLLALVAAGLIVVGNTAPQPAPEPLSWAPERYAEDWPAPPPSGAPDVLLVRGENTHWDPEERAWEGLEHIDPVGDAGSGASPAIDIREVGSAGAGSASYSIGLAGGVPLPPVDPFIRWMAYGIVVDTDGDGLPDERVGVDNMPDGQHRAWWTDLDTGQTKWKAGAGYGSVYDNGAFGGSLGLDTWYPSASEESDGVILRYSGARGRYYAWSSMIEDGLVVATDYAPDGGWLVEPEDPGLPLVGTTWTIERELPSRSMSVMMWLVFTPDGQLELELCQRGDASVLVAQGTMRVSEIALIGDPCSDEVTAMEAEILAVLAADEFSYTLDAGVLELSAGPNVVQFVGSSDPPPVP
jgi:hypothetical protein